jgi:hypothetical protein
MNRLETFQEFLSTQSIKVSVFDFLLNLLLTVLLSYILSVLYRRYAKTLSNRKQFSENFILIASATMLIITIVKSSLALSLGLVGALSIVRFRAAIKEPIELTYLFLVIAIGVGLGANQITVTCLGFTILILIIISRGHFSRIDTNRNLHLSISSETGNGLILENVVTVLKNNCSGVQLKRFDENNTTIEASFSVEFENFEKLQTCKTELRAIDKEISITLMDTPSIMV